MVWDERARLYSGGTLRFLWGAEKLNKRFSRLSWIELIRSRTAFIVNFLFIEDVDPLRPRGENVRSRVVHTIYKGGDSQTELFGTEPGCGQALLEGFMLPDANAGLFVGIGLPLVHTVGLSYVDDVKVRRICIIVEKLLKFAGPAAEGGSGVAAKNEHRRAAAQMR